MLSGDFVFDISLLQTILFALFAIMTLFQGRLFKNCRLTTKLTDVASRSACARWGWHEV
uniref:Uncharacterized protein n=1 Tax=Leptospira santarosai serovar Arenal str. MAVJ 401 TaxID=1049976 RepID=M6K485_9LEPT|nr:hypothetical protein LEP1GSC063_2811 [Leptospira santarosai serovar Arenal str. MAVJ 401]